MRGHGRLDAHKEVKEGDWRGWTGNYSDQWPPLRYGAKFAGPPGPWNPIQNCAKMEGVIKNTDSGKPRMLGMDNL